MATKKHRRTDSSEEGALDGIRVKGLFRVHIEDGETGEIVGDSGWINNRIVMQGFSNFMAAGFGSVAGSSQVAYVALGTGGMPATNQIFLPGELLATAGTAVRTTFGATAINTASTNASFVANGTFSSTGASSNNFISATQTISNIGLYATNTGSNLACGNTYGSSAVATNQNVNITYTVSWQ